MRSQASHAQTARRRELTAHYLRMLLNERGRYRSRWARLAGKTPPGEISQAAVAKVIADHLRKAEDGADEQDYRLLKDRVHRALSGRALTPSTLGLFTAAFLLSEEDTRHLWALFLGTTPDEARAAFQPPDYHVASLSETHEVNSDGRSQLHRTRQKITATKDGVSRFPVQFDSAAVAVRADTADVSDVYKCADDLFAVDVLLPKVLMKDESFDIEYVVEYPVDAKDDREFLRGVMGKRIDRATIEVKFSHNRQPREVWWTVCSNIGGRGKTVLREKVDLDRDSSSVSKTVLSVDDVVIGFRWEW